MKQNLSCKILALSLLGAKACATLVEQGSPSWWSILLGDSQPVLRAPSLGPLCAIPGPCEMLWAVTVLPGYHSPA